MNRELLEGKLQVLRETVFHMASNHHMTLGNLIEELKKCEDKSIRVREIDSITTITEEVREYSYSSYRGDYSELALVRSPIKEDSRTGMSVDSLLKMSKESIGKHFDGYKGGEYRMDYDSTITIVNDYSESDGHAPIYCTVKTLWKNPEFIIYTVPYPIWL